MPDASRIRSRMSLMDRIDVSSPVLRHFDDYTALGFAASQSSAPPVLTGTVSVQAIAKVYRYMHDVVRLKKGYSVFELGEMG